MGTHGEWQASPVVEGLELMIETLLCRTIGCTSIFAHLYLPRIGCVSFLICRWYSCRGDEGWKR